MRCPDFMDWKLHKHGVLDGKSVLYIKVSERERERESSGGREGGREF